MNMSLDIIQRTFTKGVLPHQFAWICDLPGRNLILSPKVVAQRLPIRESAQVLEIGPGSGHHSLEVAKRIPRGTLHLTDIQTEMLQKTASRLTKAGLTNFETTPTNGESLPYNDNSFDALFMVTVFGEISEQYRMLHEAKRVLKPHGILSISEHHPDPDFESAKTIKTKAESAGLVSLQTLGFRYSYTANFAAGC